MMAQSRPMPNMAMNIKFVYCDEGEVCVPAGSHIFGNALGYVFITLFLPILG